MSTPRVAIVMGSESDWATMRAADEVLQQLEIPREVAIVSAHRTPDFMFEWARSAAKRGVAVIVAGAGGAAHLPGMISALTHLPVLGVPVPATALVGVDSLLSIVQMPAGVPTATFAIGVPGAKNAAIFAARILALTDEAITRRLEERREASVRVVAEANARWSAPREPSP